MKCHMCDSAAVSVFEFSDGCFCSPDVIQALCTQHAFRATPIGDMRLIEDMTEDRAFTMVWYGLESRRNVPSIKPR